MGENENELVERCLRAMVSAVYNGPPDAPAFEVQRNGIRAIIEIVRETLLADAVIEAVAATICNDDQESVAWPAVPEGPLIPGEVNRGRYRQIARDVLRMALGAAGAVRDHRSAYAAALGEDA